MKFHTEPQFRWRTQSGHSWGYFWVIDAQNPDPGPEPAYVHREGNRTTVTCFQMSPQDAGLFRFGDEIRQAKVSS